MIKDIISQRKRAYGYIKYLFHNMDFSKDFVLDDNIVGLLDVPLTDLSGLREGANDPSASIVDSVKNFFNDYPDSLIAVEIERFLIRPFA